MTLAELVRRWTDVKASERANYQLFLTELCQALGVEGPRPAGSGYEFEFPVHVVSREGKETTNFVDLYKAGHFALEAKDEEPGRSNDLLLRRAFGQVRSYVGHLPHERPPYLLVMDVGRTLLAWDHWSGDYGGFAAARVIDLTRIHETPADAAFLRDIWSDPHARDPRSKAVAVTKEIAVQLADLAAALEREGYERERVARFLMRCVFTMFAEDVGLLSGEPFRHILEEVAVAEPAEFVPLAEALWRAMDRGDRFLLKRLLRFNGHFFADAEALPLSKKALTFLLAASRADWRHVEPSIFGTLLTRALDPAERHKMGAEYTPREYVERVVRPTVYEPLQDEWRVIQVEVVELKEAAASLESDLKSQDSATPEERLELERSRTPKERERAVRQAQRTLREAARKRDLAGQRLLDFHERLRALRFLDPACGSGNFLYVTMYLVKRIELEVLRELAAVRGTHEIRLEEVGPQQFHGIEISHWAREIAELTTWIGFHQFWREHHDVQPPEPILRDTGTLEARDAVLTCDRREEDPTRSRPDPTPRLAHPVTGALVPNPAARLPYLVCLNARMAEWPQADFIVGNPPYMGNKRMREAFGDGYVDALRATYPGVPDSADYVMYWWHRAAQEVTAGRTIRAGLITTNSITQPFNRAVLQRAAEQGARVAWAVTDHPWTDDTGSAAVRVSMTVIAREPEAGVLVAVNDMGEVTSQRTVARFNADLTGDADVASAAARPLLSNRGLSSRGFTLVGRGFVLERDEAERLLDADARHVAVIRPYMNGKDLAQRTRDRFVVDLGLRGEEEARSFPMLYDLVRDRVKPERAANKRTTYARYWWRFGETRSGLRDAMMGIPRYIATPYVAKHRFFTFSDAAVAPDEKIVCVASDDPFHLGVLSARIHVVWALAAGTRLGIGNDPTYNNTLCFDPFPFPEPEPELRDRVRALAAQLDQHRNAALSRDSRVTVTGMYNVVEKLGSGVALTPAERTIHELAACGTLRDLHDDLDRAVAEAYGWPWPLTTEDILSRLVVLHDERVVEEQSGHIRWLRPVYQRERVGNEGCGSVVPTGEDPSTASASADVEQHPEWPAKITDQIAALQEQLARGLLGVDEVVARFKDARRELVERHLGTLVMMGEAQVDEQGRYRLTETP